MPPEPSSSEPRHVVTAVLVAHDGARWLPRTLAGLRSQTRPPDRVVAVDTGSTDDSPTLLEAAVGADAVRRAPRDTGFGAAVALALTDIEPAPNAADTGWVWLLHDDCEPTPSALAELLRFAHHSPSAAVIGPKIRAWHDRRLLLEVGVTIGRGGRRETGLERREQDQGQHDGVHDVLAVSTAGMLVRRDVWDSLGGLDPRLPLFRDDLDLGWRATLAGHRVVCVTDAVVHHAEAAGRGRRHLSATVDRPRRVDRAHALYVLLVNLPLAALPWSMLHLGLATIGRVLGLLIGKQPRAALDELIGGVAVLGHPVRILHSRRIRRRTRLRAPTEVRHLLASRASTVRRVLDDLTALFGTGSSALVGAGVHRAVETGPGGEETENMPSWGGAQLRRVLARPAVSLALGLAVLTLLAARHLLGGGRLLGGALLPAPDSATQLWRTYTEAWHPVGVGNDAPAPPYLAVVAALGGLLFGNASLAVDALLLLCVPVAGVVACLSLRGVVASRLVRAWAAATYAVCPAVVGAVATGRLGTAVAAVLLPPTAVLATRAVRRPDASASLRQAAAAGLLLAVMAAFVPMAWLLAVALAVLAVAAVLVGGRRRLRAKALGRVSLVLALPLPLLAPWVPAFLTDPGLVLRESGVPGPGLSDPALPPWALLLLDPGGPGGYPAVLMVGVGLAGLAALLRPDRRGVIGTGWLVTLLGLGAGLLVTRSQVSVPALAGSVPAWPGPALLLATAGLLLAAAVGAEGAYGRLAGRSFGWRHPLALTILGLAVAGPVMAAGWWVTAGADGPVQRGDPRLLPAFVAAQSTQSARPRTLVLRAASASLSFSLLRADGPRLGDAETDRVADPRARLDRVVADLASGRGSDAAAALLPYGVRFVLMTRPVDATLARTIDAVPGMVRISGPGGSALWRIGYRTGRVRVVEGATPAARAAGLARAPVLRSGSVRVAAQVDAARVDAARVADVGGAAAAVPRMLLLADRRDAGWHATLDGAALRPTTYDGWAQAFVLPAGGGVVVVWHDMGLRRWLLWLEALSVLLVAVLMAPSARGRADAYSDTDGDIVSHVLAETGASPVVAVGR